MQHAICKVTTFIQKSKKKKKKKSAVFTYKMQRNVSINHITWAKYKYFRTVFKHSALVM